MMRGRGAVQGKRYTIWSPVVDKEHVDWSPETKEYYAKRVFCEVVDDDDNDGDEPSDDPYPDCLSAFLLWGSPAAVVSHQFSLCACVHVCVCVCVSVRARVLNEAWKL